MKTLNLIVFSGFLLATALLFSSCFKQTQSIAVPVKVKEGDTLDAIIIKLADQYGDTRDYREIRCHVRLDNGKKDSGVFPGETLIIRLEVPENEKGR